MLEVQGLNQFYGGSHILKDVSLAARPGECTVVLGRNGVGKTTLLRCLMGLVPTRSGSIQWEGAALDGLKPHQRAARGIAYVPQGREIFSRLTVRENLLLGMATLPAREAGRIQDSVLDTFPVLKEMLHRRGGDLSGGQQQQLAIARALLARPRLLILDEPTEGIQPSIIKDIGRVIERLTRDGLDVGAGRPPQPIAILLVEQYFDFAAELATRYAVLERGQVISAGSKAEIEANNVRALVSI